MPMKWLLAAVPALEAISNFEIITQQNVCQRIQKCKQIFSKKFYQNFFEFGSLVPCAELVYANVNVHSRRREASAKCE